MARVSSPAHNPFSVDPATEGVEPYVSSPSQRGGSYTAPAGYRHDFERSWLVPNWPVAFVLVAVVGLMVYLRSDNLMPLIRGTTVTRVQSAMPAASAAVNPWTGQAHWGGSPPAEATFPLNFPASLPPTAAGPVTGTGSGVYKCFQSDGSVRYQQQGDCGGGASIGHPADGLR